MSPERAYEVGTEGRSTVRVSDVAWMTAAGAAGLAIACPAARADEPCAHVVAPAPLGPAWASALVELRRQIALLPAADCQPMTLSLVPLEPAEGGVRVVAVATDGRRAERTVRHPESLLATALGLLMAIPTDATPAPPPVPAPPVVAPARTAEAPAVAPPPPRPALHAWAGLGAGVRLADPTAVTVLDVEARGDLFLDRWLAMMTIRSAVASCLGRQGVDCDVYNDVSVGLGAGRHLRAGAAAVDVTLEPSIVWMHMEYDGGTGGEGLGGQGNEVALRVDAAARLAVPLGPSWALTLTVDAGLAPSMLAAPTRITLPAGSGEAPPFPAWTGGVRLGASGALL